MSECNCGKPLGAKNKSGLCRSCVAKRINSDPEAAARRKAGLRKYYDERGGREAAAARIAAWNRNMPEEERQRRSAWGVRQYHTYLNTPETRALSSGPDARRRARIAQEEARLGWCPPELRDEYRRLTRSGQVAAAEARRMIEEMIPGTQAHAARIVANNMLGMRIKAEREKAQAY
jgi:hypothetical protein